MDRFLLQRLRPLLRKALVEALGLTKPEARELLATAWRRYERAWPDRAPEGSVGGRLMARLSELTMGLYDVLRERGLGDAEARRDAAAVTWFIYDRLCRPPWRLSRAFARDPLRRVKLLMGWALRWFPYSRPDYRMSFVTTEPEEVGFDVEKCPVAARFAARGHSDLCRATFCDLDYPLADAWGVELRRETTIAQGHERCAFRYRDEAPS